MPSYHHDDASDSLDPSYSIACHLGGASSTVSCEIARHTADFIKGYDASFAGYRVKGARAAWQEWIHMVRLTDIRALTSAANQIETKLFGILNAMQLRAEVINGQARTLKVRAIGFRSKERFKRAILFHYGGLPVVSNPHG